jgi:iron-sulfur cluster repair protein YtfE (RIC family)
LRLSTWFLNGSRCDAGFPFLNAHETNEHSATLRGRPPATRRCVSLVPEFKIHIEEEEMALEAVLCPHNQKEESILYPMIDQVVGQEERAEIFAAMDKTR